MNCKSIATEILLIPSRDFRQMSGQERRISRGIGNTVSFANTPEENREARPLALSRSKGRKVLDRREIRRKFRSRGRAQCRASNIYESGSIKERQRKREREREREKKREVVEGG